MVAPYPNKRKRKKEISTYLGRNFAMSKLEQQRYPASKFPVHFSVCFDRKDQQLYQDIKNTLKAMFRNRVRYRLSHQYTNTTLDCYFNTVADLENLVQESFKNIKLVNYLPDGQRPIWYSKTRLKREAQAILKENQPNLN